MTYINYYVIMLRFFMEPTIKNDRSIMYSVFSI